MVLGEIKMGDPLKKLVLDYIQEYPTANITEIAENLNDS